jgi:hypothetical protein
VQRFCTETLTTFITFTTYLYQGAKELGKYLDIARKFEAKHQAVHDLIDYAGLYHSAARTTRKECLSIDSLWLIDHHPELWERLIALDNELTVLERNGAPLGTYQEKLSAVVHLVREARQIQDTEQDINAVQ